MSLKLSSSVPPYKSGFLFLPGGKCIWPFKTNLSLLLASVSLSYFDLAEFRSQGDVPTNLPDPYASAPTYL